MIHELEDAIEAIFSDYELLMDTVRSCQAKKRAARGGFQKKLFLFYVDKP